MGYTGKAPGSYWIWRPAAASLQDAWATLVTDFESGLEQRRAKWARPRAILQFQFDRNTLTHNDLADIWRFYNAQRGMLSPFEVPTYGRLTTVASAYAVDSAALGVSDSRDLTTSTTSRWNRVWVENAAGTAYEVFTVTSVVNANHVRVSGLSSATAFAVGDPVYPVLKARFTQPIAGLNYLPALMGTVGISFTEVHS